jgi:hypothetical protein
MMDRFTDSVLSPVDEARAIALRERARHILSGRGALAKEWDESLYERDENGRFTSNGGGDGGGAKAVTVQELDKQMAAIKREEKKTGISSISPELTAIIRAQGFDAKPQVVSSESELTGTVMYRGVNTESIYKIPNDMTAQDLANQFATGEMHVGHGVFGDGVYFAPEKSAVAPYAYGRDVALAGTGAIITGALSPDAKVYEYTQPATYKEIASDIEKLSAEIPRDVFASYLAGSSDMSRVLALSGYDAVRVSGVSNGGSPVVEQYIILNRGAMQVVG